jgi:DNA-binding response OmpR family regulator
MTARNSEANLGREVNKRVLIIDDDASVRDSLPKVLEVAGYAVVTAEDGQQGADQLSKERFDLVLLDLDLPVLSGWDVLDLVRSGLPALPLVILTGELHQCEPGSLAGTDAVFEKPCDVELLLETIERVLVASAPKPSRRVDGALAAVPPLRGAAAQ